MLVVRDTLFSKSRPGLIGTNILQLFKEFGRGIGKTSVLKESLCSLVKYALDQTEVELGMNDEKSTSRNNHVDVVESVITEEQKKRVWDFLNKWSDVFATSQLEFK